MQGGGREAADKYAATFGSSSIVHIAARKGAYTPAQAAYLDPIADEVQYSAALGDWFGHKRSSPAESHNNALADVRETPFVAAILKMAENMWRRHRKCRTSVLAHRCPLPPRVAVDIAEAGAWAFTNIPLSRVTLSADGKSALVGSTRSAAQHRVTFDAVKNRRAALKGDTLGCDKGRGPAALGSAPASRCESDGAKGVCAADAGAATGRQRARAKNFRTDTTRCRAAARRQRARTRSVEAHAARARTRSAKAHAARATGCGTRHWRTSSAMAGGGGTCRGKDCPRTKGVRPYGRRRSAARATRSGTLR